MHDGTHLERTNLVEGRGRGEHRRFGVGSEDDGLGSAPLPSGRRQLDEAVAVHRSMRMRCPKESFRVLLASRSARCARCSYLSSRDGERRDLRSQARPPQVLHVVPVGRRRTDCFGSQRVAALAIVADPKGRTGVEPVVAAEALNLTRMEGRVAVMLARGMSVREIAAATGRKESTIRSHVKHMFTKHGLSRQAELVRLVLSLASAEGARR